MEPQPIHYQTLTWISILVWQSLEQASDRWFQDMSNSGTGTDPQEKLLGGEVGETKNAIEFRELDGLLELGERCRKNPIGNEL